MLPLEARESHPDKHSSHLPFLLVSKMFHHLAIPYLYRYVTFLREFFLHRFSARLVAAPIVATYVRELEIHGYPFERNDGAPVVDLTRLFLNTPRLRRIQGDGADAIDLFGSGPAPAPILWMAVTALANIAGATLQEMSGFEFQETTPESPAIFERFTEMRFLTWECGYRPVLTSFFFDKKVPVPKNGLPALEILHLKSHELFEVLDGMDLPSLRRVSFDFEFERGFGETFLRTHGNKITDMCAKKPTIARTPILAFCPRLSVFECEATTYSMEVWLQNLGCDADFRHTALATLILRKDPESTTLKEKQEDWRMFFKGLEISCFPALREIRVRDLQEFLGRFGGHAVEAGCALDG
ncbi:hypothetical protein C8R44DRAFT_854695 [Mycena epipterygia]|nr:hypothetical protein C8R44DRAFT_854695 [Mycena epipterygia]